MRLGMSLSRSIADRVRSGTRKRSDWLQYRKLDEHYELLVLRLLMKNTWSKFVLGYKR